MNHGHDVGRLLAQQFRKHFALTFFVSLLRPSDAKNATCITFVAAEHHQVRIHRQTDSSSYFLVGRLRNSNANVNANVKLLKIALLRDGE